MKRMFVFFVVIITLFVEISSANAYDLVSELNRRARAASANADKVVSSGLNPSVLSVVRQQYCPASTKSWHARTDGMELECREDNGLFVDWEGRISFYREEHWTSKRTLNPIGRLE